MRFLFSALLGCVLGACTFNVQAGAGTRAAESDATFTTLSADLTGGRLRDGVVRVTGSSRRGARATVTASGLLGAGASTGAISDGLAVAFTPGAGGELRLSVSYTGAAAESVWLQEVALETPASASVALDVAGADVTIDGVLGNADVRAAGGAIDVGATVRAGDVTLATRFGSYPVTVRAETASIETDVGLVTLDVTGSVQVTTTTGDVVGRFGESGTITSDAGTVRVELASAPTGAVSISTDGGEIVLGVPAGASMVLDLQTRGGTISVATAERTYDDTAPVVLTLGGGGPRVTLRAMGGSIAVEER